MRCVFVCMYVKKWLDSIFRREREKNWAEFCYEKKYRDILSKKGIL